MNISRKFIVWEVFFNRYSLFTMLLIFLHQAVVAISAFFLTRAIEKFERGGEYSSSLLWYFFCMVFPYLPGYLSFVTMRIWVMRSHRSYINATVDFLKVAFFRNQELRVFVESAAARGSFIIINDLVSFFHGFAGFFLNSLLSFAVIGLILPGDIFFGYISSVVLCMVLILVTRQFIERAATDSERSFVSYTAVLDRIWPNVVLENRLNKQAWKDAFNKSSGVYYGRKISLEVKRQLVNFCLSMFAVIPTVYLLWSILDGRETAPLIAVVIVNLTRIFHILGSLSALVSEGLDWFTESARVRVLFELFDMPSQSVKEREIIFSGIEVNGCLLDDSQRFIREIVGSDSGRYTICGSNGSGKTALMLVLKAELGEKAIYMPAGEPGLFWPSEAGNVSTGQHVMRGLRSLIADSEATHLLLDEWDANLDKSNVQTLDAALETESRYRVVVEVRH